MNKLLLLMISCLVAGHLCAQDSTSQSVQPPRRDKKSDKKDRINRLMRMEEEGDLIFNKHNIFGFHLATDGYGISFEKGKFKTPSKTLLFQFELNEKKSPKEKRITTGDDLFGSSVVAYKLNNFYSFKMAIGQQQLIGGKGNKNGVAVTGLYSAGISIGILKPYYINVINRTDSTSSQKTYDQALSDTAGDYVTTGAAGFTVGWGHVTIKPGLNAKVAMRFDYGRFNQTISAIEAGLTAEYYFGKIPQVYLVPQRQFFFNGYVAIMFGSRK